MQLNNWWVYSWLNILLVSSFRTDIGIASFHPLGMIFFFHYSLGFQAVSFFFFLNLLTNPISISLIILLTPGDFSLVNQVPCLKFCMSNFVFIWSSGAPCKRIISYKFCPFPLLQGCQYGLLVKKRSMRALAACFSMSISSFCLTEIWLLYFLSWFSTLPSFHSLFLSISSTISLLLTSLVDNTALHVSIYKSLKLESPGLTFLQVKRFVSRPGSRSEWVM